LWSCSRRSPAATGCTSSWSALSSTSSSGTKRRHAGRGFSSSSGCR
jgi:hypothetical protein